MNILLATKTMDMGGIERCVVALARELRGLGHEVWVVSSGGYLVPELERGGTPHVSAPLDLASPMGVARSAATIRRLVDEHRIDLVHSFAATASVALNLALRPPFQSRNGYGRARLVSSPMGLQNSPREKAITTWLRNWFLTLGAERILVISPEIRRHLVGVGAREESLIDFNFVGLDVDSFSASPEERASVRREFGFPEDAPIVSTIGALHPRKSHDLFVDMAASVIARVPRSRFLVIGAGDMRQALEDRGRANGLEGKLVFTGVRDDVARLLAATDVYAKPGVLEGFIGITVLEALALGKPVVAYETDDVKLALVDGVTGYIVPNGDVAAMAERVVQVLRDPSEALRMGETGKRLVHERFHFGVLAKRLERFYQQMLQARHS